MATDTNTQKIQELNDKLRQNPNQDWFMSQGVAGLPNHKRVELMLLITRFNDFNEGNDPYSEHDFGAVTLDGVKYFWKISYYDKNLEHHSENPADPDVTRRILNIMEASEY